MAKLITFPDGTVGIDCFAPDADNEDCFAPDSCPNSRRSQQSSPAVNTPSFARPADPIVLVDTDKLSALLDPVQTNHLNDCARFLELIATGWPTGAAAEECNLYEDSMVSHLLDAMVCSRPGLAGAGQSGEREALRAQIVASKYSNLTVEAGRETLKKPLSDKVKCQEYSILIGRLLHLNIKAVKNNSVLELLLYAIYRTHIESYKDIPSITKIKAALDDESKGIRRLYSSLTLEPLGKERPRPQLKSLVSAHKSLLEYIDSLKTLDSSVSTIKSIRDKLSKHAKPLIVGLKPVNGLTPTSAFDLEFLKSRTLALQKELEYRVAKKDNNPCEVCKALSRVAVGTYGYDTRDTQPIHKGRLEALPWVTENIALNPAGSNLGPPHMKSSSAVPLQTPVQPQSAAANTASRRNSDTLSDHELINLIAGHLRSNPGSCARDIAKKLSVRKKKVNSLLYREKIFTNDGNPTPPGWSLRQVNHLG